eukprot:13682150-Alexandrium_andersonii.AAC.1
MCRTARSTPRSAEGHDLRLLARFLRAHAEHAVHDCKGHELVPEVGRTVAVPCQAWATPQGPIPGCVFRNDRL